MPYRTQIKWTLDEALKLNKAHMTKVSKGYMISSIIIELIFLIGAYSLIMHGDIAPFSVMVFAFLIYPLFAILVPGFKARKAYMSNKCIQNAVINYEFHEDKFVVMNTEGHYEVPYSDIYKVVETSDRFYIYISNNQAYGIVKSNCESELIELLRSKCS